MVKILDVMIKTIDDKNHVKILRKEDIELDSIVIKSKQAPKPAPPPVEEAPPVEEPPVEPEKPKKTRKRKPKKA